MTRVVTFLMTADPAAALHFYRDMLGFTFLRDDEFALVFEMHGTTLRIAKAAQFSPAQHTVLGWEVEDIHSALEELQHRGITFECFPNMGQDEMGICTFPSNDKVAWFKDPDGNLLSITQLA